MDNDEYGPFHAEPEPMEYKLDAYGHMSWTVGNEDWVACFDARRNGDSIEYHVVVDCESGGFTDTLEHGMVKMSDINGIANMKAMPDYWVDICSEHYIDSRKREHRIKVRETAKTRKAWAKFIDGIIAEGPCSDDNLCHVCDECREPGPDPVRDGWVGSDGRP